MGGMVNFSTKKRIDLIVEIQSSSIEQMPHRGERRHVLELVTGRRIQPSVA